MRARISWCSDCGWWEFTGTNGSGYGGTFRGCWEYYDLLFRDKQRLKEKWDV